MVNLISSICYIMYQYFFWMVYFTIDSKRFFTTSSSCFTKVDLTQYPHLKTGEKILFHGQWPFQEPIHWRYLPYIRFRILKFPLTWCQTDFGHHPLTQPVSRSKSEIAIGMLDRHDFATVLEYPMSFVWTWFQIYGYGKWPIYRWFTLIYLLR
jgi:hypothetical protein